MDRMHYLKPMPRTSGDPLPSNIDAALRVKLHAEACDVKQRAVKHFEGAITLSHCICRQPTFLAKLSHRILTQYFPQAWALKHRGSHCALRNSQLRVRPKGRQPQMAPCKSIAARMWSAAPQVSCLRMKAWYSQLLIELVGVKGGQAQTSKLCYEDM